MTATQMPLVALLLGFRRLQQEPSEAAKGKAVAVHLQHKSYRRSHTPGTMYAPVVTTEAGGMSNLSATGADCRPSWRLLTAGLGFPRAGGCCGYAR